MTRPGLRLPGGAVVANTASRLVALVALGLATVLVARTGGPGDVGVYALMRVLPGLAGVMAACGLPSAAAFFVAGPTRDHPRLWPTITLLTAAGSVLGAVGWLALTPVLHPLFFATVPVPLVAATAAAVASQLPLAVAKGCLQGLEDLRATNRVIACEELAFLPAYVLCRLVLRGPALLLAALVLADVVVSWQAWRLVRRHRTSRQGRRADPRLAAEVCRYGVRGQVGGVLSLLNLRLDFALLGALAGPAVLGTYAIASKYAELLRLPGLAVTWVLYPRVARAGGEHVAARLRGLLPRAVLMTVAVAVPLAAAAGWLLPTVYGAGFRGAVVPAYVLIGGLWLAGASGLSTAYLFGTGRPGLNSLCLGLGVGITVVLDLLLIPRYGALGAAAASALAYGSTDVLLVGTLLRLTGAVPDAAPADVAGSIP